MEEAVLCHPVRGDDVLLIEKQRGIGAGKVVGPGGKLEGDETPRAAAIRETREEVGLDVVPEKVGEFHFGFADDEGPFMFVHVFRADEFSGTVRESPEAVPRWYPVDSVPYDEMWADDRYWFPLMLDGRPFRGRFVFTSDGDDLQEWELDMDVTFG